MYQTRNQIIESFEIRFSELAQPSNLNFNDSFELPLNLIFFYKWW